MLWGLVAILLWTGLACGLVLGVVASLTDRDLQALEYGLASLVLITIFSWLAVMSIGPFVMAIAVVLTMVIATRGRPLVLRAASVIAGGLVYWTITWGVPPTQSMALMLLPAACLITLVVAYTLWRRGSRSITPAAN